MVRATAYFSHISRLKFAFPLVFSWKPHEDGNWRLGIERERGPESRPALTIDDVQLKQQVTQAQAQYREQQPALQTALSTFKVTLRFVLPGEIANANVMAIGEDRRSVTLALEGKKISAALDKFMADEATVAATIRSGNDLLSNDDFLLDAMFGRKGPVGAMVHVAPGAGPAFDYERESRAAMAQEAQMLRDAGVETVPQVIVRPSTRPR